VARARAVKIPNSTGGTNTPISTSVDNLAMAGEGGTGAERLSRVIG
jgi:hypothetical protein